MPALSPIEMFSKLVAMGYVTPGDIEPSVHTMPSAYRQVPTSLAFSTPPIPVSVETGAPGDAKLGLRSEGNK
jgi:hypothetical protein